MPSLLLVDYLQRSRAQYALLNVASACTAAETVRLNHLSPRRFAKVVMARVDSELVMVVMPAHYRLAAAALRGKGRPRQQPSHSLKARSMRRRRLVLIPMVSTVSAKQSPMVG